ncbi:sugar kinase [Paracoccus sp. TK19116]|uniref:Sugar kinase n=1 Tax=Paracoccus albicereus TaxID=2922394 RepID=A0ABT1MRT1_9RHOB|nr:sugar kinase [Paracoccus albicereus]MCQ0970236.1 sugar kinase [Paracoccus albicereus]
MSGRILCIGEAMVELSQTGDSGLWRLGVAGDTLNTAWYLRRLLPLEWRIGYFSRVGSGEFSQKMIDFLDAEGIDASTVGRDPDREIGLYAITLTDGERSFAYWRDSSAARRLADDAPTLQRALTDCDIAYLSGITLAILPEDGRQRLIAALADARRQGTRIVFDTNLRPRLWSDAATMRHWIETMAGGSDLILPSFDDEQQHFDDTGPAATIARYRRCGAQQVIVKAGGAPVHYGGSEGEGSVDGLVRDIPVDTTAAGDSFNAGYLAARIDGAPIADAIRRAHELSRRVIGARGALVPEAVGAD